MHEWFPIMAEGGHRRLGERSMIRHAIIRCNRYFINICELTFPLAQRLPNSSTFAGFQLPMRESQRVKEGLVN